MKTVVNILKNFTPFLFIGALLTGAYFVGDQENPDPVYYEDEVESSSIEDGTHSATVDYYNPVTGQTNTYNLEVEDGEVTEIDFPNGGYLDDSHISPTEIEEDGKAHIEDDRGRSFDVEVEPD